MDIIKADPAVANVIAFTGGGAGTTDKYRRSKHGTEASR